MEDKVRIRKKIFIAAVTLLLAAFIFTCILCAAGSASFKKDAKKEKQELAGRISLLDELLTRH